MKLCKDCKWFGIGDFMPRCLHPKSEHIDPVTGEKKFFFCNLERFGITACGPEAVRWEAKS
jgi:hypothetical protein